jgi:hypothetical protein
MNHKYPIHSLKELRKEKERIRRAINGKEQQISNDYKRLIDTLTPINILSNVASKIATHLPVWFGVFSLIKGLFKIRWI